jgi:FolB domain-containing protein
VDRILIEGLEARCIIGVQPRERLLRQWVRIDMAISLDLRSAARSDRLEDALDYRGLRDRVLKAVEESKHHLLEALAETIADTCLQEPAIRQVRVILRKPGALRSAWSVGVAVTRGRD